MPNIDLDSEFLELFYGITNSNIPANIDLTDLKQQLIEIVSIIKELNDNAKKPHAIKALNQSEADAPTESAPAMLVVDDLGVITYQLKILLSNFDYDIDCSQEIYDAVGKFKKRDYDYVIMDLFIPTEREGFILLTELRKMANATGKKTVIGVITASPRKEIEQQCKARGADFFLEKNNDWQKALYSTMESYIKAERGDTNDEEF